MFRIALQVNNLRKQGYPWIVEAALKNRFKQFVIDGEAVVLGEYQNPREAKLRLWDIKAMFAAMRELV